MYTWERIPLEGIFNTRDLGGIETADGKKIKPCRLIRSGELFNLSDNDKQTLTDRYSLKKVIDFRTGAERSEKPDPILDNVQYIWAPIMSEEAMGITHDEESERDVIAELFSYLQENQLTLVDYMTGIYKILLSTQQAQREYGRFFRELLSNESGSVLWHCSAGKDRVGVGTALLLTALGVPRDVIIKDYLMTNTFTNSEYENAVKFLKSQNADEAVINGIEGVFKVRESYIMASLNYMEANYGSVNEYINKALGITKDEIAALQNMYLEN